MAYEKDETLFDSFVDEARKVYFGDMGSKENIYWKERTIFLKVEDTAFLANRYAGIGVLVGLDKDLKGAFELPSRILNVTYIARSSARPFYKDQMDKLLDKDNLSG